MRSKNFVRLSVLDVILEKAGVCAARIRDAEIRQAESDAVEAMISLSLQPGLDETNEERKAREEEEALEKGLDEVEEELWSHGTVGRDLADVHHNLSESQSMTEQELETQDFPLHEETPV